MPATPSPALRPDFAARLTRRAPWVVAFGWLVARALTLPWIGPDGQVQAWFDAVGTLVENGSVPPLDLARGLVPTTVALLALPRLISSDVAGFARWLAAEQAVFDVALLVVLYRAVLRRGGDEARLRAVGCGLAYAGLTFLVGPVLFARCDLVPALAIAIALDDGARDRRGWRTDVAMAIAFASDAALLVVPLLVPWLVGLRRRWPARLGALVALATWIPMVSLRAGHPPSLSITSTASNLIALAASVLPIEPAVETLQGSKWIGGDAGGWAASLCFLLAGGAGLAVTVALWRRLRERVPLVDADAHVTLAVLVAGLAFLVLGPAPRGSRLAWILPPFVLWIARREGAGRRAAWLVVSAFVMTRIVGTGYLHELGQLEVFPTLLQLARNGLLAAAMGVTLALAARPGCRALQGSVPPRAWLGLATFAALAWVVLANTAVIVNNDVFLQLRVGGDLVATHLFPRVDTYSALAAGRPFIAHEWLASVVFFAVDSVGGAAGLALLQPVAALAIALLMLRALAPRDRSLVYVLPFFLACVGVVASRAMVRPHLFSLVALAAVMSALGRWRRTGRWVGLLWLVPVQIAWANLHGEYPLGPLFVLAAAGGVGLGVAFPRLQGTGESRRHGWADVASLAGIGSLMAAATLVNPYGVDLVAFSARMFEGNAYIKQAVFEWGPTFTAGRWSFYGFDVYVVLLVLLWAGIALRWRTVHALDVVLAAIATFISVRAIRFLPVLAIVGFPVLVQTWAAILADAFHPFSLRRRPALELALAALLVGTTLAYGFAYDRNEHRPLGLGVGGDLPYDEVAFLRDGGYQGVVFNEFGDGALLIHDLAPRIRPVMDSRIDIYGEELWNEYREASRTGPAFSAFLKAHQVNLVLRTFDPSNRIVYETLATDAAWTLAFRTKARFLFVRK